MFFRKGLSRPELPEICQFRYTHCLWQRIHQELGGICQDLFQSQMLHTLLHSFVFFYTTNLELPSKGIYDLIHAH
jgi:hypothetical protein